MIERAFEKILQLSVWGSVLAITVIAIRLILKNKIPKQVYYLMWILVFLKFLVPINFSAPLDLMQWVEEGELNIDLGTLMNNELNEKTTQFEAQSTEGMFNSDTEKTNIQNHDINNIPLDVNIKNKNYLIISTIWFLGLFFIIGILMILYIKVNKRYKYAEIINEESIFNILDKENSCIKIYKDKNAVSPMVLGFVTPKIILPIDFNCGDAKMLNHMILHELQHIKWKDCLVNLLALMIVAIHWFNPIMWIVYILFRKDIEGFCDERVIRQIGLEQRADYANSLLHYAIAKQKNTLSYGLSFSEHNTKERVKGVIKYKKMGIVTISITVCLIIVLGLIFVTNGTIDEEEKKTLISSENDTEKNDEIDSFVAEDAVKLFKKYSWTIDYIINVENVKLPEDLRHQAGEYPDKIYWAYNNELSKHIGLDYSNYLGEEVTVEIYYLTESLPDFMFPRKDARGIVLRKDEEIIGAYIDARRHACFACSLDRKPIEEITGKEWDGWIEGFIDYDNELEAELASLSPEEVIRTYYEAINSGNEKRAFACYTRKNLSYYLSMNMDNKELYNDEITIDFNTKSVKVISIKEIEMDNPAGVIEYVVNIDVDYKRMITCPDGEQPRFVILKKETERSGWKIVGIGTGP